MNGSENLTQQVQELTKGSTSVSVDARPIQGMVTESNAAGGPGITLGSSSGSRDAPETVSHRFFVHTPNASPNVSFARSLGLEMAPSGYEVKSGPPFNTTNVPGAMWWVMSAPRLRSFPSRCRLGVLQLLGQIWHCVSSSVCREWLSVLTRQ